MIGIIDGLLEDGKKVLHSFSIKLLNVSFKLTKSSLIVMNFIYLYFSGDQTHSTDHTIHVSGVFKPLFFASLQLIVLNSFLNGDSYQSLITVPVLLTDPPTITESKSNEATTGRQASLKCEASAVPAPDFEWYRDDTRYVPSLL